MSYQEIKDFILKTLQDYQIDKMVLDEISRLLKQWKRKNICLYCTKQAVRLKFTCESEECKQMAMSDKKVYMRLYYKKKIKKNPTVVTRRRATALKQYYKAKL